MIEIGLIEDGIRAAGNRYMLCVLASQRAKQISRHRRETDSRLGPAIKQALSEIIRGQVSFYIEDKQGNRFLPSSRTKEGLLQVIGDHKLLPENMAERVALRGAAEESNLVDYTLLSLYALARVNLEHDARAFVGETYSVQVGISSKAMEEFEAQPFNIPVQSRSERLPFDFMIHLTGNLKLVGDWHQHLLYDPLDAELQSVDFKFRIVEQGQNQVDVDCYYQRRWLRTFQFTFDSLQLQLLEHAA